MSGLLRSIDPFMGFRNDGFKQFDRLRLRRRFKRLPCHVNGRLRGECPVDMTSQPIRQNDQPGGITPENLNAILLFVSPTNVLEASRFINFLDTHGAPFYSQAQPSLSRSIRL